MPGISQQHSVGTAFWSANAAAMAFTTTPAAVVISGVSNIVPPDPDVYTFTAASQKFQIGQSGLYRINFTVNAVSLVTATTYTLDVRKSKDDVTYTSVAESSSSELALTGALTRTFAGQCVVYLDKGDYVKLYGTASGSQNGTLQDGSFVIQRVA